MMTIEYKILYELRFLHDYYLIDNSGKSFFGLSPENQRLLLQKKLRAKKFDINNDINIFFSPKEHDTIKNFRLKVIKTPLGFYIATEVKSEVGEGGIIRYKPVITPSKNDDHVLTFGLGIANARFSGMNNIRLNNNNFIYYFTNKGDHIGSSLSKTMAMFGEDEIYRMGDLVLMGETVHQAIEDNDGNADKWRPLTGQGFVHQGDLSLNKDEAWYKDWLLNFRTRPLLSFGLIQIFFQVENTQFSPIDDEGYLATKKNHGNFRPTHPIFEMRFLSRATYWRYKKTDGFTAEEVEHISRNAQGILVPINNNFVTVLPRQLSQETTPLGGNSFRLPNAPLNSIKTEEGRLYSDIYFNSINPIPNFPTSGS